MIRLHSRQNPSLSSSRIYDEAKGADLEAKDNFGNHSLDLAILREKKEIAEIIGLARSGHLALPEVVPILLVPALARRVLRRGLDPEMGRLGRVIPIFW